MIRPHFRTSVSTSSTKERFSFFGRRAVSPVRFSHLKLSPAEQIAALRDALTLAARPELDHLAVRLAELAISPDPIHASDLSPRAILNRWSAPRRQAESQEALDGLVASAERYPDRIRDLVVAISSQRLPGSLDRALSSTNDLSQRSAIRLIEQFKIAEASPALLHVLGARGHPQLRRASHAAFSLANHAAGEGSVSLTQSRRRVLEGMLAEASWGFEPHRSRQVLLAAMLLITADPNPEPTQLRLRRLILEPDWSGHAAIRSALRNTPIASLRGSAWRWIRLPPIASAALDRVCRAESQEEHEAMLTLGHLALAPARARVLRLAADKKQAGSNLGELFPNPESTRSLSEDARVGRVRMVSVFRLGSVFTRSLLEPCGQDPSPRVRLAAVATMGSGVGSGSLADAHPGIARSAAAAWSLVGVPSSIAPPTRPAARARLHAAAAHSRSPHPGVRRIVNEEINRINPWNASSPASRLSARRWLESDAPAFLAALRARLVQPEHAVNAIVLARTLRVTASLEKDLLALAQASGDFRVVATAVAALGELASPASAEIIACAMNHTDDRVRANALESRVKRVGPTPDLMQADDELHSRLTELKHTSAHRVRAGAIRALLDSGLPAGTGEDRYFEPKAADELGKMLDDERPMHRVSGLWVASRVLTGNGADRLGPHWRELAARITELADDAEPSIRRRASRCSERLLAEIRHHTPTGGAE